MKFLGQLLMALGASIAFAALIYGTESGKAENVTITDIKDGKGIVFVTLSSPLKGGPSCGAKNRSALVIGNGIDSPDAVTARRAFSLGQALKVAGGGICNAAEGFETLASIEVVK